MPRFAVCCSVAILMPIVCGCADQPADQHAEENVTLRVADRGVYEELLTKHKGKVILVDFWATWCALCMQQFSHTVEMHEKYGRQGLAVISVSLDDPNDEAQVRDFLKQKRATFDNLLSKWGASDPSFEAFNIDTGALPHYQLYDRSGKLRRTFSVDPLAEEQFGPEDIEQALKELLDQ